LELSDQNEIDKVSLFFNFCETKKIFFEVEKSTYFIAFLELSDQNEIDKVSLFFNFCETKKK